MSKKALLIFSGHNQRAVLALCRSLSQRSVLFYLIASTEDDTILNTKWREYVVFIRKDKNVNIELFRDIRKSFNADTETIYVPTTEYINNFVLENREKLEEIGLSFSLVTKEIYNELTSKEKSIHLVESICGLSAPEKQQWNNVFAPCVFKPIENINKTGSAYPILCFREDELKEVKEKLDPQRWFVQKYVSGQSLYLCGYLAKNGDYKSYWQVNLIQQPNGKSMVLAKGGDNPGVDEAAFFKGLFEFGYFGPVMMEIIQTQDNELFYIEINPRFWGPLQLGVDICPEMIDLFVRDYGFQRVNKSNDFKCKDNWYSWKEGSDVPNCKLYPAAKIYSKDFLQEKINQFDVNNRDL